MLVCNKHLLMLKDKYCKNLDCRIMHNIKYTIPAKRGVSNANAKRIH